MISVEDIRGKYRTTEEFVDPTNNEKVTREVMNLENVIKRIVLTMTTREREGKKYGIIVIAEGLAELMPYKYVEGVDRDDHGHINISAISLHDHFWQAHRQGVRAANRCHAESDLAATWLRSTLRHSSRI